MKLHKFIANHNLQIHAPNELTYYSYNENIIPDILDILITQNINLPITQNVLPELDSDHYPVIINIYFNSLITYSNSSPNSKK